MLPFMQQAEEAAKQLQQQGKIAEDMRYTAVQTLQVLEDIRQALIYLVAQNMPAEAGAMVAEISKRRPNVPSVTQDTPLDQ